jgi:hypothetical protein
MCELRNSHYDTGVVKWRALIGLEAVSESYSCMEKLTLKLVCIWLKYSNVFMVLLVISLFAFISMAVDKSNFAIISLFWLYFNER